MISSAERWPVVRSAAVAVIPRRAARHVTWLLLGTLVVVVAGVYYATLLRDVGYAPDTAKFQYLGRVLGTAHQPGYPLFTGLLALAVRILPVSTDAFGANLLSAVFGVAACAVAFLVLLALDVRRVLALAGALLVGFSRTFWSQAVVVEVYTLSTLFAVGVLALLLRWERTRRDRDLVVALALYALSLAHTTAALLLAPGVALFVACIDRRVLVRRQVLRSLPLFALLAIGPYAYIVWRTLVPAPYVEVTIRSVGDLLQAVSGTGFRDHMLAFGPWELIVERIPMFATLLRYQPLMWVIPLAVAGAIRMGRRPANLLLGAWCGAVTLWALEYAIVDVFVYFILTYVLIVVWATVGFDWLVGVLPAQTRLVAAGMALLAPLAALMTNHAVVDRSEDSTGRAIRSALARMSDGGVVFSSDYHYFNYYLLGEGQQEALRIYAAPPAPMERIVRYCRGESIDLGDAAGAAPPNLPVYAYNDWYLESIQARGFVIETVRGQLARIDCSTPPPQYVPLPDDIWGSTAATDVAESG
ncbi:MAG TPA: DUF2723 domain-containing protein [Nitriliruptorales bacterium]|nr:DUF2723 domain-containing protein [Nitriliruptorales bacterium]